MTKKDPSKKDPFKLPRGNDVPDKKDVEERVTEPPMPRPKGK